MRRLLALLVAALCFFAGSGRARAAPALPVVTSETTTAADGGTVTETTEIVVPDKGGADRDVYPPDGGGGGCWAVLHVYHYDYLWSGWYHKFQLEWCGDGWTITSHGVDFDRMECYGVYSCDGTEHYVNGGGLGYGSVDWYSHFS